MSIDSVSGGDALENGTQSVTITITDNESAQTVTLSRSAAAIDENSSSTVTITATLSNATYQDVTISIGASGGTEGTDYASVHGTEDTGVVAQQIEALGLPGITTTRENGTKAISYKRLTPILIEAIKELDARLKTLEG